LWHLPAQSPLAVLRQDVASKPLSSAIRVSFGVAAITGLLLWYSNNLYLSLAILAGFGVTALASVLGGLFLLAIRHGIRATYG
jgi:putative ABC transport system permease protein